MLRLPEADAREQEARVAAVLGWLQSRWRWLLILDNADTPEAQQAVGALLPPGLPGYVIVTSRRGGWPIAFADLEVRVLAPKAAEKFLLDRTAKAHFHAGTPAEARAVAEELGFLPLALEQAAAYLVQRRVSFAECRRRLAESRTRLLEFASQGGTGYQRTVATTWLVTEAQLSPRARAVLQLAALLAPDEIPRAMFTQGGKVMGEAVALLGEAGAVSPHPDPLPKGEGTAKDALAGSGISGSGPARGEVSRTGPQDRKTEAAASNDSRPSTAPTLNPILPLPAGEGRGEGEEPPTVLTAEDVDDALAELAGYSLIELEAEGFTLHRLLQAVLHDRLDLDIRRVWVERAVQLVNDFAPSTPSDVRTWPVWARVRPHVTAILQEAWDQANPTAALVMNQLGLLLKGKALYAEAELLYRRALAIHEKSLGPEHPKTQTFKRNYARLQAALGQQGK